LIANAGSFLVSNEERAEIAKEMGISEKTVEAHLGKALTILKGNLPDTGALLVLLAELLNKK
jgi:FixJ family two-component response regulator